MSVLFFCQPGLRSNHMGAGALMESVMIRVKFLTLAALLIGLFAPRVEAAPPSGCPPQAQGCSADVTNGQGLANAVNDSLLGVHILTLWNTQCNVVYGEDPTNAAVIDHIDRLKMCYAIAAGHLTNPQLLQLVLGLSPVVQTEILTCQGGAPPFGGCLVDADVNTAIVAALTVKETAPTPTTATAGANTDALTVASATGIVRGSNVFAAGVPPGTTVTFVNGQTVYISNPTTAALSGTPVAFVLDTGLPTRSW
jgi:hypothetical protein